MSNFLLDINNLNVEFTAKGKIKVLSDVTSILAMVKLLALWVKVDTEKYDSFIYHEYDTKSSGRISSGSIFIIIY